MPETNCRVNPPGKVKSWLFIAYGCIGLSFILYQILAYKEHMRPLLDIVYPTCTPNNVSGANFLAMFTQQSNLIVAVWLIVNGAAALRSEKAYKKASNPMVQGAVTTYIFVTGLIYCGVLFWFQSLYPWDTSLWFYNIINFWQHVFMPALMTTLWFFPRNDMKTTKKVVRLYLVYPIMYFVFCIIRGALMPQHFYPYPFLSAKQFWVYVAGAYEYNHSLAILLIVGVIAVFCSLFFGCGVLAVKLRSRSIYKRFESFSTRERNRRDRYNLGT